MSGKVYIQEVIVRKGEVEIRKVFLQDMTDDELDELLKRAQEEGNDALEKAVHDEEFERRFQEFIEPQG